MNQILRRRRAIIGARKRILPIYSIYNQSVTAGNRIATGQTLWKTDKDFSMLYDFTVSENPSSGNGSRYYLIYWQGVLSIRKYTATSTYFTAQYYSTSYNMTGTSPSTGRQRLAITHKANSDTVYVYYKKDDENVLTFDYAATFEEKASAINLGGESNGALSLPSGTIAKVEIYDAVLGSSEINAFLA